MKALVSSGVNLTMNTLVKSLENISYEGFSLKPACFIKVAGLADCGTHIIP